MEVREITNAGNNSPIGDKQMDMITLYQTYYEKLYNYALRLSCHPQDALDLTQDTFLTAMTKIDTVMQQEAIFSWLKTICYHKFIDQIRKNKDMTLVEDLEQLESDGMLQQKHQPLPEEEVLVSEEIRALQNGCFMAMVRKLTLNQRIIFSLVDMYGMKADEVAKILQISDMAAKGLLYRARMNIDSFFADHCDLIKEENPCSCSAWIAFSTNRNNMQKQTREIIDQLDYRKEGYQFDGQVRRKVYYLYKNMPQKKPPKEWYQKILNILQENINQA